MSIELNQNQIKEIKALLAHCGLEVKKARQARVIVGEGAPGKRPKWWHGTNSGATRKMVAKHGRWEAKWPPGIRANHQNPAWEYVYWDPMRLKSTRLKLTDERKILNRQ